MGDDATTTDPPRKAAIAFLAKAYLQKTRWDNDKQADYQKALDAARLLIEDCETGGLSITHTCIQISTMCLLRQTTTETLRLFWKQRWAVDAKGTVWFNRSCKP